VTAISNLQTIFTNSVVKQQHAKAAQIAVAVSESRADPIA
jgi:hypothetical protein